MKRLARSGVRELFAAAALLVAGCEATAIGGEAPTHPESEVAEQRVVRQGQPPELNSLFGKFGPTAKLTGTLCNENVEVDAKDGLANAIFSSTLDTLDPSTPRRGTCTAEFEVTLPAGYQVGAPSVCASVSVSPQGEQSARAKVGLKASYPGTSTAGSVSQLVESTDGSVVSVCASFPQVLTQGCGSTPRSSKFALTIDVEATPETYVQLSGVELDLTYADGALFRSCSSQFPLPAPSATDAACGGLNRHPCAAGLACRMERLTYGSTSGRCMSQADANKPRAGGEVCGAAFPPACGPDLLCSIGSAVRDGQPTGTCSSQIANQGETCGGTSGRTCRADLFCSPQGRCADPADETTTRREGDPCDGQNWCQLGLTCDAETRICRKSALTWGEGCRNRIGPLEPIACSGALTCISNVCRNVDGPAGAACVLDRECTSNDCDTQNQRCR